MGVQPVLINGEWRRADAVGTFRASNPATGEALPEEYPISGWSDCEAALTAATRAATELRTVRRDQIAAYLSRCADRFEARKQELVESAHLETAYPRSPRLGDVELPRTTSQLRQAAAAALDGSWALPTIDTKQNIRSVLAPIGPVAVFGPNNFPFAFNGAGGGDFAAAVAAGNPVIVKGHPLHPGTTRMMAEELVEAASDTGLTRAIVQMIYRLQPESGLKLVADDRVGASAFTGSRAAGLALKKAADAAGKPIYLEMSSINPVLILPRALAERGDKIAEEFVSSALLGGGQFCTNPGFVVLLAGPGAEQFVQAVSRRFAAAPHAQLLSSGVARGLAESVRSLRSAGAQLVTGGESDGSACRFPNTLLRATGGDFLRRPESLQEEAFGAASLVVVAQDDREAAEVLGRLEGSLTGTIYSESTGGDDALYESLAPVLRQRVGRLLDDKMPTGVAVSAAMNHGGPYPSTGHPGFTAVGIPASLRRFAALQCYDNVRASRLPDALGDKNPNGRMWRLIDGEWTQS
jgi:2,5-dioxopentanoate dehydrogenase